MAVLYVSEQEIREIFASTDLAARREQGELSAIAGARRHRAPADHPRCTYSMRLNWYDQNGELVASFHQFLLPNGEVGGSGSPDPKMVRSGPDVYVVARRPT